MSKNPNKAVNKWKAMLPCLRQDVIKSVAKIVFDQLDPENDAELRSRIGIALNALGSVPTVDNARIEKLERNVHLKRKLERILKKRENENLEDAARRVMSKRH